MYFISFRVEATVGTKTWDLQNAIIDIHPLTWLKKQEEDFGDKAVTRLFFWSKLDTREQGIAEGMELD